MARRLNYFMVLKQIHLVASIVLLTFVFIFLFTGIVIVNRNLFTIPETKETIQKVPVDKPMNGEPGQYADYLKKRFG